MTKSNRRMHGLISGYAGGYFYPGNNATRAQAAKVVSLAMGCTY